MNQKLIIYTSHLGVEYVGVFDNEEIAQATLLEHLSERSEDYIWIINDSQVLVIPVDDQERSVSIGNIVIKDYTVGTLLDISNS